jgi:hypothetical protein
MCLRYNPIRAGSGYRKLHLGPGNSAKYWIQIKFINLSGPPRKSGKFLTEDGYLRTSPGRSLGAGAGLGITARGLIVEDFSMGDHRRGNRLSPFFASRIRESLLETCCRR